MNPTLESYREHRDQLLVEITTRLSQDERFVAGWLTGSFSSNDEDSISDIDLSFVVSDQYSETLCKKFVQVSAQTSSERYSLFSQFGTPALIHENNNNAPEAGTFTFILYAESAIMVDWVLIPQSKATRPLQSRLLFEKANIPISPLPKLEDLEQSRQAILENWAFFWMMIAITIKYVIRDDGVFVTEWIEHLHNLVHEIERRLDRESWKYVRGSLSTLQPTPDKQIQSIRGLCNRMLELKPRVIEFTGSTPATPISEIEELLSFAHDVTRDSQHQSKIKNRQS